jgi:hypothetical protein
MFLRRRLGAQNFWTSPSPCQGIRKGEGEREKKGKTGWEHASKAKQLSFLLALPSPAPLATTHLPPIKYGHGRSSRKLWQQPIWEGNEEQWQTRRGHGLAGGIVCPREREREQLQREWLRHWHRELLRYSLGQICMVVKGYWADCRLGFLLLPVLFFFFSFFFLP